LEARVIETDVLVVGGGGAGFRAAIAARENNVRVLLLSKGPLARCGASPMAGADYTLDGGSLHRLGFRGDPKDSREKFFSDIVTQGYFLNNQKLVDQYVRNAPDRLKELLEWGLKVDFSEERAIDTSGIALMNTLLRRMRKAGAQVLEDTMLLDLLKQDGQVIGGLGLDVRTGEFIHFKCRAVIMATGGWHKAFWPNTGMRDLSGEGIAMAHRAGAEIGNMEFITFCCNVLLFPPVWRGSIATYIMGLVCGGELTNREGEAFLQKYDPYTVETGTKTEWNKCFISFASRKEVIEGKGSPHGGVYYGTGKVPWEDFERSAMTIFPNWKYKAMDLAELGAMLCNREQVEVGPAVEYFDGGILVNEQFETSVRGLYAAGECTLGPFGSNRVCSAITEIIVQGADAGRNAAEYAAKAKTSSPDAAAFASLRELAELPLVVKDGVRPAPLRRQIQEMAHEYLGPIRNQRHLSSFIAALDDAAATKLPNLAVSSPNRNYNKEWIDALELRNTIHLLQAAARSALCRTESRGVHFREDYPYTDNDHWVRESVVSLADGELRVTSRPITVTAMTPPKGRLPFLDMMKKMMESRSDVGGCH
jgi:succinate dehydrogenase/fumarate reductase flavoprotein subunit